MHEDIPDSPEGVALALLRLILDREGGAEARDFILGLYDECLALTSRRIAEFRKDLLLH